MKPNTVQLNTDLTTKKLLVEKSEPKTETFDGYTAEFAGKAFEGYANIDFSLYDFVGSARGVVEMIMDGDNDTYREYFKNKKVEFYRVDTEGNVIGEKLKREDMKSIRCAGAKFIEDTEDGCLRIFLQEMDYFMQFDYSSIKGDSGAYIRLTFHAAAPMLLKANVSEKEGDFGDGLILQEYIRSTQQADGSFMGYIKMDLPWVKTGEYFMNFCDMREEICYGSVPVSITEKIDPRNPVYHLQYAGDWDAIIDKSYQQNLTDLFYNTYPRLCARWGVGTEPKVVTMGCGEHIGCCAFSAGDRVVVDTGFANDCPLDIGYFSHELTHTLQQFDHFYYGDKAWFTENMATYGGFRYFHWTDARFVQVYQAEGIRKDLYDWNWDGYGYGCKWFFCYMDYRFPTTKNADGTLKRGLIDALVYEIKAGRLTHADTDCATDPTNLFNTVVKEVTGYDCIEDIRKEYEEEFSTGKWDFIGFANYSDNFLTEDVPFVENPVYPMLSPKNVGDKTAAPLSAPVTEGENLTKGATIVDKSGQECKEESADKLIDGDPTTKWCSTKDSGKNMLYALDGTAQWVVIDLGEEKTFNTYTVWNTKSGEPTANNMTEWTLAVSSDNANWTVVDYQPDCDMDIVSFNIGAQTARYILLRAYTVDQHKAGTIRLFGFGLYNL